MNDIQVTLRGNVATEPRQLHFDDGNSVTSFRLASNSRRFDRERQEWIDRGTTYVSVNCRRAMGLNAVASVHKGQPVVITGKLRERAWSSNGRSGVSLQIEAETLGHDLSFGTSEFRRIVRSERAGVTDLSAFTVIEDGVEPEREFDLESDEVEELVAGLSAAAAG